MMPSIEFLKLNQWTIYEQLQLEEALLRADNKNWCIVNENASDAVVMGISGKKDELINQSHFEKNPVPVIRRFSGGGCVFVDHNTFFVTLILNKIDADVKSFPSQILCWTKKLYEPLIKAKDFCVRENDYVIGNHKFGGNAQCIIKDRWLHHTSLLWDFCPKKMQVLAHPKKTPDYRNERKHEDFLCTLKPLFSSSLHFWNDFKHALSNHFTLNEASLKTAQSIVQKPHRKATCFV